MLVPKRHFFFFIDYLALATLLGSNVFFWDLPDLIIFAAYLLLSFLVYFFTLFLFSGSFIRIKPDRRPLRTNLLGLFKGVFGAIVIILGLIFFFFQPYRSLLFYHTILTGIIAFCTLCLIRFIERQYVWPRGFTRVLILGREPYLHLYLKDIVSCLSQGQGEILIAISAGKAESQSKKWWNEKGPVHHISWQAAKDLIASGSHFSAVVLGRDPLEKEFLDLLPQCYQNGYSVMGIGPFYELVCRKLPLFQIGTGWLIHTSFQPPGFEVAFFKRALDFLLSIFCLVVLLPVSLLVALAIKLDSRGPVFFIQDRTGRGGKTFRMYKFRSMKTHADDSHKWPHWEPGLVTRVGLFIRSSGLDEIPQLINIIRGDMSFVGPRPARPMVTERHIQKVPFYAVSLAMRPGITGWAQLRQGQDIGDESMLEKIRYNLYYAKNFSPWFDLEIILKTARMVFSKEKPGQFQKSSTVALIVEKQQIRQ
jgi:exopolysaccharide biosynthesis polyprenyl glycosylphosphotransferase